MSFIGEEEPTGGDMDGRTANRAHMREGYFSATVLTVNHSTVSVHLQL
jgi:hypothetical protein